MATPDSDVYLTWPDGYVVRRMRKEDAPIVQKWFGGLCPTSCDLELALDGIYPAEVHGFYVGEFDGEVVASAIRIPVCSGIYYGSLYYVEKKYRKLGLGKRLRDEVAVKYLGDSNMLAIDAHDELEEMNKKRGYQTAHKVTHYCGLPPKPGGNPATRLLQVRDIPFEKLIAYDNKCFVRPNSPYRRQLLEKWVRIDGGAALVAVDTTGDVIGFGCRRPAIDFNEQLIGPLYGDSYDVTMDLVKGLANGIKEGATISMSISESNPDSVRLVAELGLTGDFHMIRMYLNGKLDDLDKKVYALTSIDVCGF